jgi:hypothetical protein
LRSKNRKSPTLQEDEFGFENSKLEYRNPKQIQNATDENSKLRRPGGALVLKIWILKFDIVSDFDIRASDFSTGGILTKPIALF